ncbi:MAG TPA: hypothetical protein VNS09_12945 [Solirubrobacter sp.]|nr:hypothetical protein [Solirubrobacter sp.]
MLTVAVLALAGCGSSSSPAPVPEGFVRASVSGATFDHPRTWTREEPQPGLVSFYGAAGEGGLPPQVGLGGDVARNELADSVRYHEDQQRIRFPDYRVTADRAASVAGATAAHLIDAQYTMAKPGSKVLVREVNLLVLLPDGRQLDFFVRSPAGDYAGAKLDAVFDSFRVR